MLHLDFEECGVDKVEKIEETENIDVEECVQLLSGILPRITRY